MSDVIRNADGDAEKSQEQATSHDKNGPLFVSPPFCRIAFIVGPLVA